MTNEMNASRFAMWRAVVAMVHADEIVTPHEVSFVNEQVKDLEFSDAQLKQLSDDFKTPQDITTMFSQIKSEKDKRDFFTLARALSWCDGDFDVQEAHIINVLEKQHLEESDIDLLSQSRDAMKEVELGDMQWILQSNSCNDKGMFSFLREIVSA